MKFCTRVRLKPINDRGELELDRAKNKNYIAENSVALGHDTHNRPTFLQTRSKFLSQHTNAPIPPGSFVGKCIQSCALLN